MKVCSEALFYCSASCLALADTTPMCHSIQKYFNPVEKIHQTERQTKLLCTVFNGGKASGSLCKYAKVYLIVDGAAYAKSAKKMTLLDGFMKFSKAL